MDLVKTGTNMISDYLSQVYVIHQTGLVILSRKYSSGCVSNDPQLIGGFLAALLTFAKTSGSEESKACEWEEDRLHKLKDIGMSCSRWFILTEDEYTIAALVPYTSLLLRERKFDIIEKISQQIISTFLIFRMFDMNVDQDIKYVKDYSSDFGNTIDNIVFEQLKEIVSDEIIFEIGDQIEVSDKLF